MKTVMMRLHTSELNGYQGYVLAPMIEDDQLPEGEMVVDIKKNRNAKNHRRFFAFVKATFDMQDHYDSIENWRKILQMRAGHYDPVVTEKGGTVYMPRSINWDELDETEFRPLFNDVINAFTSVYGERLTENQWNQVLGF
jgi:hypothetical protein